MKIVRPVRMEDLDAIKELAAQTGVGLTTLPNDRELLRRRILEARASFERIAEAPRGGTYLFVLEDVATSRIGGTCGITSKVGGFDPFYAYEIRTKLHESEMLGVRKEIRSLHLVEEHNGPCEIGSLFLTADFRGCGVGRLLSLSRFLFMARHPALFDPIVIAELRGVVDESGRSPFWDALGRHFFEVEYPTADELSFRNKKFIADLMPRHPIYIPLLPLEAQAVIGRVAAETRRAHAILEAEGFEFSGMVDIFEAGPIIQAHRDSIRTVRDSRTATVREIRDSSSGASRDNGAPPMYLIANTRDDFRACTGMIEVIPDGARKTAPGGGETLPFEGEVRIDAAIAEAIEVAEGDAVVFATLYPGSIGEIGRRRG
jgi:arginine N-succinyltransferase